MQPQRYVVLDAIPRNPSGKHDIPRLREDVLAGSAPARVTASESS
jgi:hypothetical protein